MPPTATGLLHPSPMMSRLTPHNPLGRQQPGSGTPDTCCPGQRAFGTPGVAVKHAPPARGTIAPHAFSSPGGQHGASVPSWLGMEPHVRVPHVIDTPPAPALPPVAPPD